MMKESEAMDTSCIKRWYLTRYKEKVLHSKGSQTLEQGPREAVGPPSLQITQNELDVALKYLLKNESCFEQRMVLDSNQIFFWT